MGSLRLFLPFLFFVIIEISFTAATVEILSKSKLERCVKVSESDGLNCDKKIVVNVVVPSGSSGGDASIGAVMVEENNTQKMQIIGDPPIITINKSAAYALYEIMYIRDVAYKPEEFFVKTRKCEPDASAKVVQMCERLQDEKGQFIEHTQPVCCPCGPQRRVPSSCGNVFDKMMKGKANTAHCLRFPGDWFHVFGVGRRSLGFSVRIEVKRGSKISEVIVGPENRTVLSTDSFLRVNLIGDFAGYTSLPSFEDFYLVIPRQGTAGFVQDLGRDFSRWMLLERVRFSLDGLECDKIGVSYEAYNGQPNFCSSPFWSCLHNQLWNFWEADQNRIGRNQSPQYVLEGRFERINQHPNAGTHSFSIGITEVLNTNILIELSADDVQYMYQRSDGKILSVIIPTFEALTQFGTATATLKNIGELEASYSMTFECSSGVSQMEEQYFSMKPEEVVLRSFKLYPTTDQAANYICTAVLKASDYTVVDSAECQFTTTTTVLDNGTQINPTYGPESGTHDFLGTIRRLWSYIWNAFIDFFTGKSCRSRCLGFFDFGCHIQYMCLSWIALFSLLLAILPTGIILLWLLHQKGFFDPLYDWWEDRTGTETHRLSRQHLDEMVEKIHLYPKTRNSEQEIGDTRRGYHISHGHHKHWHSAVPDRNGNGHGRDRRLHVHHEHHKHRSRTLMEKNGSSLDTNYEDYMRYQETDGHRHGRSTLADATHINRYSDEKQRKHKRNHGRIHEHAIYKS